MDSVTKVYFSYCYPYSYTRVHRLVRAVEARIAEKQGDSNNSNYLDAGVTMLGKSIAGNNIEAITLGTRGKPLLLIMARAHPSETVASFVMEGVVRMLMSEEVEARFLLEQCRVLLVPMLNPDGVVHGNSRSSYAGCDLNRRWVKPMKELQPEILAVKRYIRKLLGECQRTLMSLDLHGHSGKENLFFYGCQGIAGMYEVRQLPTIMCRLSDAFSYKSCCYYIQEDRLGTARVALARDFRGLSYTLETSVMGSSLTVSHFQQKDYMELGRELIKGLAIYRSLSVVADHMLFSAKFTKKALMNQIRQAAIAEEANNQQGDDSSDSEKSQCNLPQKVVTANIVKTVCRTSNAYRMRQFTVRVQRPSFHSRFRKRTDIVSARQSESLQKHQDSSEGEYLFNFKIRRHSRPSPL